MKCRIKNKGVRSPRYIVNKDFQRWLLLVDFYTCLLPSDHYGGFEWPPFGWSKDHLKEAGNTFKDRWFVDVYVLSLHGPNPYLLFWNGPFFRGKKLLFWGETLGGVCGFLAPKPSQVPHSRWRWYRLVRFTDPRCSYAGTGFRNIGSPAFGMKRKPSRGSMPVNNGGLFLLEV